MEIFSAALSLLAIFVCSIIFIPILLLVILFFGYDKMSPQIQSLFKGLFNLIRKWLNLPVLKQTTVANTKKKSNSKSQKDNQNFKPANFEDAEFREVKSS